MTDHALLAQVLTSRPASEIAQDLFYDAKTEEFERVSRLAAKYRGLRAYQGDTDRRYLAALGVNLQALDFKFEFSQRRSPIVPDLSVVWMWVYVVDDDTKARVYCDPPYLEIGVRSLLGFGVTERPGWRQEAERLYLPPKCIAAAEDYLEKNKRLDYLES